MSRVILFILKQIQHFKSRYCGQKSCPDNTCSSVFIVVVVVVVVNVTVINGAALLHDVIMSSRQTLSALCEVALLHRGISHRLLVGVHLVREQRCPGVADDGARQAVIVIYVHPFIIAMTSRVVKCNSFSCRKSRLYALSWRINSNIFRPLSRSCSPRREIDICSAALRLEGLIPTFV